MIKEQTRMRVMEILGPCTLAEIEHIERVVVTLIDEAKREKRLEKRSPRKTGAKIIRLDEWVKGDHDRR